MSGNYVYCAPTHKQAKRIAWQDLKDMTEPFWLGAPSESELVIRVQLGNVKSDIHVFGMDKPERIEGSQWHGIVLDEYGNMKESVWGEHVQPVTSDTGAWVDFIGVPEGRNHYFSIADAARRGMEGYEDWGFWTWPSSDVLDIKRILEAKRTLDPRTYRQEYEASFETASSTAYYVWTHEAMTEIGYNKDAESFLCWDFNAGEKPMATVLVQKMNGTYYAVKEWCTQFTNTEAQCLNVFDWLTSNEFAGTLHITGDYAGTRRESNASFSDYAIIESHFKNFKGYKVKKRPTRAVKDRVASLNALILNAKGERRFYVNKAACPELVKDLERVEFDKSGQRLDESDPMRTHLTDAVTYFAYNFHPIERKQQIITSN